MPLFEYEQLSPSSSLRSSDQPGSGVIDAPDRAAAIKLLRDRGITPKRLDPISERRTRFRPQEILSDLPASSASLSSSSARVSKADLSLLVRDLSVALSAGLTLVQALRVVQRQARGRSGRSIRALLEFIITHIEQGKSLADAAQAWGRPFDDLLVGLFRAGEQSGRLVEVLDQAASMLERSQKMRRNLAAGMIYPGVLAVLIAGAVTVVVTFVVPKLLAPLAGRISFAQLPWPTRVVLTITDFISSNWLWIIIGLVLAYVLIRQARTSASMRVSIDRLLLRLPALGPLSREIAVARFSRTLSTLISAGLPVISALRSAKTTVGNKAMEAALDDVITSVEAGKTISEPMEQAGSDLFPPMLTQIVGVGEKTGRLSEMLDRAAAVFEDRSQTSLNLITLLVPIALVLSAALAIFFIVLAVFLALLEVQNAIG